MAEKSKNENLETRPPIVVVMGHIDHGKTTLLDYIRKSKVAEGEAGGITQHTAAYEIEAGGNKITFIDTPGHEAFTNIRHRGAKIADIAILVVAADDKVNEQTVESIEAIKKAEMPFVVAINKIDKESANTEKIKKELSEKEVFIEEWGGKTPCIEISAKTGKGIEELLEMINLIAEMEELKTNPKENATGYVLESHKDPKRGISATLLLENGFLKRGMFVVSGEAMAPVRIFENFASKSINEAGASMPVKIIGFNISPEAGVEFKTFEKKKEVEVAIQENRHTMSVNDEQPTSYVGLEKTEAEQVAIPVVIKTDVLGSKEALEKQIKKIPEKAGIEKDKLFFNVLRSDVGEINEDDIKLASSAEDSLLVGFNVKCSPNMILLAENLGVNVKLFNIIYEAEDFLKEEALKRKPIEEREEIVGKAKILKIFRDEKNKKIIGGEVLSGKVVLGRNVKIYRRDFLLGEGKIVELKRVQDKVNEIGEGEQFGALIQTKASIESKDKIEVIEKIRE